MQNVENILWFCFRWASSCRIQGEHAVGVGNKVILIGIKDGGGTRGIVARFEAQNTSCRLTTQSLILLPTSTAGSRIGSRC